MTPFQTRQAAAAALDADTANALLGASAAALLRLDPQGRIDWANPAATALAGAAPLGQTVAQWLALDETDGAALAQALAAAGTADLRRGTLRVQARALAAGAMLLTLSPLETPAATPSERRAIAIAGLAWWRHDLASGRVEHNEQARAITGSHDTPAGMTIDDLAALIHPDDRAAALDARAAVLAGAKPADVDLRMRHPDGTWRTVLTRRAAERDDQARVRAITTVAVDISGREDATRRASELGRRFELATRFAGIGHWSVENLDAPAQWSEQMRAIHGLGRDETPPTLREWIQRFVDPAVRVEGERNLVQWAKAGFGNLQTDLRIVRTDGEVRHLMSHSSGEVHGSRTMLFGLVIDITERRRAARALRTASERALLAARAAGIGTWVLDCESGISHWDDQMWRLRGLEPRPETPSPAERLEIVHPEDRDRVARQLEITLDADEAPSQYEFRIVLPDGQVRWLASRSMSERDESGRMLRRIGVNWDVTDRRNAESARRERELALRESKAKEQFLSRMSHELRTPLNGVLGFAQLLLAEESGADPAAALRRRRTEQIRAAGAHLLELINGVLDLASLERDELRIATEPVALAPLVAQTLPALDALRRQHEVEIRTGELDAVVLGDPARLRQVLINLLSNAVKYNRPGGRVTVEARQEDGEVQLTVADNGRGMNAKQLDHLFEPFNHLGTADEPAEGTGIGLAIAKALVERMSGRIEVESRVGFGSRFELRLRSADTRSAARAAAPALPRPPSPAMPEATSPRPRGTLLYVEDNPVNALIITELVARRPDLRLHIAANGQSGLRMAHELRPDLVLLDMHLPDLDGHEVLRRLRAAPETAAIPVIAVSANAMPDAIDRALRAGMSDYWTKPLDFAAFSASLEALFGPPA